MPRNCAVVANEWFAQLIANCRYRPSVISPICKNWKVVWFKKLLWTKTISLGWEGTIGMTRVHFRDLKCCMTSDYYPVPVTICRTMLRVRFFRDFWSLGLHFVGTLHPLNFSFSYNIAHEASSKNNVSTEVGTRKSACPPRDIRYLKELTLLVIQSVALLIQKCRCPLYIDIIICFEKHRISG